MNIWARFENYIETWPNKSEPMLIAFGLGLTVGIGIMGAIIQLAK